MIALILDAVPAPVWAALAAIVAAVVSWAIGRREGAQAAKTKAAAKAADDLQTANEVQNDNAAKSGDAVRDDLGQWVRDK